MVCPERNPVYVPHSEGGLKMAISKPDGYSIALEWTKAFPDVSTYSIAYNIYFSTIREDVFKEGPKYVSIGSNLAVEILELTPGDTFYFAVRATEYDPGWYNLNSLPDSGDSKVYPDSPLASTISDEDGYIPLVDVSDFPAYGVVQIGGELIRYVNKDVGNNFLTGLTRGFLESTARFHQPDGYDGHVTHDNPLVLFWKGHEDPNEVVHQETASFAHPHFAWTLADGYKSVNKSMLITDLGGNDAQSDFPRFDFVGWRRTDPVALLRGDCVGTYYGGEQFCADGYLGVGRQIRGLSFADENNRRQEVLLEMTGEPVILVRRMWAGIRCSCFAATTEYQDDRCQRCFGGGFVTSYEQFHNPRRSDGRILVRFSPATDDLKMENAGLESTFLPECWTLTFPAIRDRDFIIRFNADGTEEFRYEVLDVTRNVLLESISGAQKFRAQRVRKTDPINQWRALKTSGTAPTVLTTSVGFIPGANGVMIPHTHTIVIHEGITSVSQINQTTSVSQGHNHEVRNGVIVSGDIGQETGGIQHTHTIII